MPLRRYLVIGVSLLAIAFTSLWLSRSLSPSVVATEATDVSASARTPTQTAPVPPPPAVTPTSRATSSSVGVTKTLSEQVDEWWRSGDPHQAKLAYDAVFQCLLARRRARAADQPPDEPGQDARSVCGDLRSDQVQQRLAFLEAAARAGEKGAALNFIQEGPSGNGLLQDLATTDPTPPTADWLSRRNTYIELALQRCDLELATYLGWFIRQRETRQKATTLYWLSRMNCPGRPPSNTTPLADDPEGQADLDALTINGWQQ